MGCNLHYLWNPDWIFFSFTIYIIVGDRGCKCLTPHSHCAFNDDVSDHAKGKIFRTIEH